MTASPRPTCRPDTPSVSVCLSQQRGTRQTEGRSPRLGLPGTGARSARTTPGHAPRPGRGDPFFTRARRCARRRETSRCLQSFLSTCFGAFHSQNFSKSNCQMFSKNKASAPAGTSVPALLGCEGDALLRFRERALGSMQLEGARRGLDSGAALQRDAGPLREGLPGRADVRRSLSVVLPRDPCQSQIRDLQRHAREVTWAVLPTLSDER